MRQALARWLLGGLFVAASLGKILHPADFADAVSNYQLLPALAVPLVALTLPWLELLSGSLCLLGLLTDSCALTLALLCGGFEVALVSALVRGLESVAAAFMPRGARSPGCIQCWTSGCWVWLYLSCVLGQAGGRWTTGSGSDRSLQLGDLLF